MAVHEHAHAEREPRHEPHLREAELVVQEVEIVVQTFADAATQFDLVRGAIAEDVERLAGLQRAQDGDETVVGGPAFVANLLHQFFLVHFALQVADGATGGLGEFLGAAAQALREFLGERQKVLEQHTRGAQPGGDARDTGQQAQRAAKPQPVKTAQHP